MPHPRLTSPRTRFAFVVGWSLLTLVAVVSAGYALLGLSESDFNLEAPVQVRSIGAMQETVTAVPTSRVVRLTPTPIIATQAVPTEAALASSREHWTGMLSTPPVSNPLAQPTATPPAKGPDLVANGSFEAGASSWYFEGGAGPVTLKLATESTMMLLIPAGGGYADQIVAVVPGGTYGLLVSGRMTGEGDTGLLGVVYRDGSGSRMRDLEPPPITFSGTEFVEKLLVFTVPAGVVDARVYAYKEPGSARFEVDGISVQSTDMP